MAEPQLEVDVPGREVSQRQDALEEAYYDRVHQIARGVPREFVKGLAGLVTLPTRALAQGSTGMSRLPQPKSFMDDSGHEGGQPVVAPGEVERTLPVVNVKPLYEDMEAARKAGVDFDALMANANSQLWDEESELDRARQAADIKAAQAISAAGFSGSVLELASLLGIPAARLSQVGKGRGKPKAPDLDISDAAPPSREAPRIEMPAAPKPSPDAPPIAPPLNLPSDVPVAVRADLVNRWGIAYRVGDEVEQARIRGIEAALDAEGGTHPGAEFYTQHATGLVRRAYADGVAEGHMMRKDLPLKWVDPPSE